MQINRNSDKKRYELVHDHEPVGTLTYSFNGDLTVLERIEIDERFSGQGLAGDFTAAVLGQMRDNGESIVPKCPYVRGWILQHPQWRDVVAPHVELSA